MVIRSIERTAVRLHILLFVLIAAHLFLAFMLWRIQVAHGHLYAQDELRQSVRRVQLPGMRGRIYDRQGRIVVDNRPGYGIAMYLEEIRRPGPWARTIDHVEQIIQDLSEELDTPPQVSREDIQAHVRRRLPLPLMAWRDVDERIMARWAEQSSLRPGVDLTVDAVRVYPYGAVGAHLLGYVGRAEAVQDPGEPFHYYLPDVEGKSGIEAFLDSYLRGRPGGELLRVDAVGYRHHLLGRRDPEPGDDIQLTIDLEIQRIATEVLGNRPGSIVVLDPRNGDVLAMVSAPGYDPNLFVPSISAYEWRKLVDDPRRPMINRAVAGRYVPGSIFKPVVALAALQSGRASPDMVFHCPGHFDLGNTRFHCWLRRGHGDLNMRQALERSCNVYFYRLALQSGYDHIYGMGMALGLGRETGVELNHEVRGLLPNDAWKRRVHQDAWRDGDTCNLAIGQGPIVVTPIQMAVMVSAIANGGQVVHPRLVKGIKAHEEEHFHMREVQTPRTLAWPENAIEAVRGGMFDAIMSPSGTGRRARVSGVEMAGKTGTAEYGPPDAGLKYAWIIGFAPYRDPRYAFVIVVDSGVSGGETAAPMLRDLMSGIRDYEAGAGGPGT